MPYAQNASSGFALRTYRDPESRSRFWPSEGPTRRPSDSEQKRGGGGIAMMESLPRTVMMNLIRRIWLLKMMWLNRSGKTCMMELS